MVLRIPLGVVALRGQFSAVSAISLEWNQSEFSGQAEEWSLISFASTSTFLGNEVIGTPRVVPVPAALPMLASALALLGYAAHRRRKAQAAT